MRKKSHISLASYLLHSDGMEILLAHKKAFYWGNLLPDCVPSFLTRRHSIDETFPHLQKELQLLVEDYNYNKGITGYFCRHLGIVLHYVADYFTFPHNSFYPGNMREHCKYEKEMKFCMRAYVKSDEAKRRRNAASACNTVDEICQYIKDMHRQYAKEDHNVQLDCEYIALLCHRIADFILSVFEKHTCYRLVAIP